MSAVSAASAVSASPDTSPPPVPLLHTPLHALHLELGARMVPFAGYHMPVQYPDGLLAEHRHTRHAAGLFDVSHMGQIRLLGPQAAAALETLIPMDVLGLGLHKQRYGLLLTEQGTVIDDLMLVNRGEDLYLIVNGACKHGDLAHLQARMGSATGSEAGADAQAANVAGRGPSCRIQADFDRALLALQGPLAVTALQRLLPGVEQLVFMTGMATTWQGAAIYLTRSGYTGEDGFEISLPPDAAEPFARALLAQPEVKPIGLGARNSLRLEAGLCLYGQDIDTHTTPVEAGLVWAMQKVRRSGGARAGGFPGADHVLAQLDGRSPLPRQRVGLVALERVPVREHTLLHSLSEAGVPSAEPVGEVTSGLLAPSVERPIAMAYVHPTHAAVGTRLAALVRGKAVPMEVAAMPFVQPRYFRG